MRLQHVLVTLLQLAALRAVTAFPLSSPATHDATATDAVKIASKTISGHTRGSHTPSMRKILARQGGGISSGACERCSEPVGYPGEDGEQTGPNDDTEPEYQYAEPSPPTLQSPILAAPSPVQSSNLILPMPSLNPTYLGPPFPPPPAGPNPSTADSPTVPSQPPNAAAPPNNSAPLPTPPASLSDLSPGFEPGGQYHGMAMWYQETYYSCITRGGTGRIHCGWYMPVRPGRNPDPNGVTFGGAGMVEVGQWLWVVVGVVVVGLVA